MRTDKQLFVSRLIRACRDFTGCNLQYKGCPCNICFHTFAEDVLGLSPHMAHEFWQIVLVLRGDYTEAYIDEIKRGN